MPSRWSDTHSRLSKCWRRPVTGGPPPDVPNRNARDLNGVADALEFSPGAFAGGVFDWGSLAVTFQYIANGDWQDLINLASTSGTGESGVLEVSPGNQLWIGFADVGGVFGPTFITGRKYFLLVAKPTGAVLPVCHVFDFTTQLWSHTNASGVQPNPLGNVTKIVSGVYPGGFDGQTGIIATVGAFRHWTPTNVAIEAANMHLDVDNWVIQAANADRAAVLPFNTALNTVAVQDATGGGANETTTGKGTVVTNFDAVYDNG